MPIVASMGRQRRHADLDGCRARADHRPQANAARVLGKEVLVGGLNGTIFAVVISDLCSGRLSAAARLRLDEGVDSGPIASPVFVTTVIDVMGFFVFLGLGTRLLL